MLSRLGEYPSIAAGHLAVDHSFGTRDKVSLREVRYVLLSPHDPSGEDRLGLTALPDTVRQELDHNSSLLEAYLQSERDAGIDELRQGILRRVPGGLSLSAQINRGICNLGRDTGPRALPPIWTFEKRAIVEPPLLKLHGQASEDTNRILDSVRRNTLVIFLHSMDPCGFPSGVRPSLSPETMANYVAAQGLPSHMKRPRKEDFITGQREGAVQIDMDFYTHLQAGFSANDIQWEYNQPYDTEPGYPDWTYMQLYPGRVSVVDLTKTRLCKGTAEDFDPRSPRPDAERVAFMAELYSRAIQAVTR